MPSVRSQDLSKYSPTCRATPIGSRSPTHASWRLDDRGVTFRWKDYRAHGSTRYKTMTLATEEFMRRFLLHVLPSGFHRIRHYGLLANANRKHQHRDRSPAAAINRPRCLLPIQSTSIPDPAPPGPPSYADTVVLRCSSSRPSHGPSTSAGRRARHETTPSNANSPVGHRSSGPDAIPHCLDSINAPHSHRYASRT